MKSWTANLLRRVGERTTIAFAVRHVDGTETRTRQGQPEFTIVFRNPRAYWRVAAFGHVGLLEAYFDGDVDVEGSLPKALAAGMEGQMEGTPFTWIRNRWHELTHSNAARSQARANAEAHYALPPEFYKLWLDDPLMLYTCAYWIEGTRTLEEAQRNKCDHVARKLLLKPGEEVVDVGSGFGGFMFHAHERYGVKVTAINTTGSQAEHARREIERRRLGNALSMQMHEDFRDAHKEFDKVASIGCLEHAGRDQLAELIRAHAAYLKKGGIGLIHFIGHVGRFDTDFFIRRYVFPGGWIPSLAEVIVEMEKSGLEILDIENLRRHYALTLDVWAERFDRHWDKIRAMDPKRFDERFRRIWRVYLYGCAEMFRSPAGRTHLFQIVFSKGNVTTTSYPMGREFLYREALKAAQPEAQPRRVGHG